MKIIFMGTPYFAVPILQKLIIDKKHQVVAVFTAPPKPRGRKLKFTNSPVHELALQHQIPVSTPSKLRTPEIYNILDQIEADIIVVAAYGFIIPQNILHLKKYGCLNVHPSMLPKYRGAAPLQWTIINGDEESAVCIMQMDAGLDTGDIILQQNFPVLPRVNFEDLHDFCANLGADLLLKVLVNIDSLPRIPQNTEDEVVYARKLNKEDGKINWQESAKRIDSKIRAMNPWPGAYFEYQGKIIKITQADYDMSNHGRAPGAILNNNLEIACGEGVLKIKKLKAEGKRELSTEEFLKGNVIRSF